MQGSAIRILLVYPCHCSYLSLIEASTRLDRALTTLGSLFNSSSDEYNSNVPDRKISKGEKDVGTIVSPYFFVSFQQKGQGSCPRRKAKQLVCKMASKSAKSMAGDYTSGLPEAAAVASGEHAGSSSAGLCRTQKKRARDVSSPKATKAVKVPKAPKSPKAPKAPKVPKEKPEKRLVRYSALPNIATEQRIERALNERLYLLDRKLVGDDPNSPSGCEFNVLGLTGNVYEVKLQQQPCCTCPDYPRSRLCKHMLFVMLKVLKLDRNDPRVWQRALLTSELRELLQIPTVTDDLLASHIVRQRFQQLQRNSGQAGDDANKQAQSVQREISGDCPICYETMDDGNGKALEPVVFCKVCGNNVHRDCFEKWSRSSGASTTCIYCRALWSPDEAKSKNDMSSGYLNLADVSAVHSERLRERLEDTYSDTYRWWGNGGGRRRRWS